MTRFWWAAPVTLLLAGVGLDADGQGKPPAGGRGANAGQAAGLDKPVTLDGCILSAEVAGVPPGSPSRYVFAAQPEGRGEAGGGGPGVRYFLDGDEKAIAPHLNHVVEVTGIVVPLTGAAAQPPPPAPGAAAGRGEGGRGRGGRGPAAAPTRILRAQSVKMVAAIC
jgi:hypothetical protein